MVATVMVGKNIRIEAAMSFSETGPCMAATDCCCDTKFDAKAVAASIRL